MDVPVMETALIGSQGRLYPKRLGLVETENHHEMLNMAQCRSLCNEAHWLINWGICVAYLLGRIALALVSSMHILF